MPDRNASSRSSYRPPAGLPRSTSVRPHGRAFGPGVAVALVVVILGALAGAPAAAQVPLGGNEGGIMEPVLSKLRGTEIRVPHTDQSADGRELSSVVGEIVYHHAIEGGVTSLLGHEIQEVYSPHRDLRLALSALSRASALGDEAGMTAAAQELEDILLGTTQGRMYDGFAMLNFNRWKEPSIPASAFPPDAMPGEYKMKLATDTGETFVSPFDGETRKVWEVSINHLYYDGQIDSDTFLVRFPAAAHPDDTLRVHYKVYSLVEEDFSPTLVMLDYRLDPGTVQFPFKGFDAVWIPFRTGEVLEVTVDYPPIRMVRGIYDWGWREHPPRIQFVQPIYEIVNQHTGEVELDPQSRSFADRNREELTLDAISDAAPEKKMYRVAEAVLGGAAPATVHAWLTDPGEGPRGTWPQWIDLAANQLQLPPEAWDLLSEEDGLSPGVFGDYELISVYMNNEMYGDGPRLPEIDSWQQGDVNRVKLINLDNHTHYFRNVDFGSRLHDDMQRCCGGGLTSFEIMNFKPFYGAPKVAEVQWRAGWGFRPHLDALQQTDVFPRAIDRLELAPYTGGTGEAFYGYRYSEESRGGDFRFDPPPFIIGTVEHPAAEPLRDADGERGLSIGRTTEGYGVGRFCPDDPYPGFCTTDVARFNPHAALNFPPPPLQGRPVLPPDVGKFPGDVYPDHAVELRFPPFLRNPDQGNERAGDIIPPTVAWRPFLWLNPANGTLFIDPDHPELGYWADLTYSHGAPVYAGSSLTANIEAPRAAAQVFYQFDDLFHDNSIFSPHPLFSSFVDRDDPDSIEALGASMETGTLWVQGLAGRLFSSDRRAGWLTVYAGAATADGCTGAKLGAVPVDPVSGVFELVRLESDVAAGSTICVQTVLGAEADAVVIERPGGGLRQAPLAPAEVQ